MRHRRTRLRAATVEYWKWSRQVPGGEGGTRGVCPEGRQAVQWIACGSGGAVFGVR